MCGRLTGGDLAEVQYGLAGNDVAGDFEGGGADAEAFDVADAVEGGGAVGGGALREEGAGDVAVGEGEEGDVEVAGGVGSEGGAGGAVEEKLAGKGDVECQGFGGQVGDGELAGSAEGAGGSGGVVGLVGEDLEAGALCGVGAGEREGVGGQASSGAGDGDL